MFVLEDTIHASSEEIKILNDACTIDGGHPFDAFLEEMDVKALPKRFRCRVCGRHYDFKGEAKACERDHKQWRR